MFHYTATHNGRFRLAGWMMGTATVQTDPTSLPPVLVATLAGECLIDQSAKHTASVIVDAAHRCYQDTPLNSASNSHTPSRLACCFTTRQGFVCHGATPTALIPRSRIGDGVCDCCDGADEPPSVRHGCPDTCTQQSLARQAEAVRHLKQVQRGRRKRSEMAAAAARMRLQWEAQAR